MRQLFLSLVLCLFGIFALTTAAEPVPLLETSELKDFDQLPEARQNLIKVAIETGKEVAGLPYKFGGNGADSGGFDCSGAMYAILRKINLKPARTSYGQFAWIRDEGKMNEIPADATALDHPSFANLQPGDLVFWTGTYAPTEGREIKISHVGMYLGLEKKDGRPVMINATSGRSYRGTKGNGFGVYDFRVPRAGSKSKIVGYGTPPGLLAKK